MLVSSVIGLVIPNLAVESFVPFPYTNVIVYSFSVQLYTTTMFSSGTKSAAVISTFASVVWLANE